MAKMSRREFLRMAAAGLGALAVQQLASGCQRLSTPPPPPSQPGETPQATPTWTEAPQAAPPTEPEAPQESPIASAAAGYPDLAVARRGEPEELVRRALAALGGMEHFVPQGSRVVVKPNICIAYHTYEYAATTNPWVVGALVKLALEAGARSVRVMDYPFGGTAEEAYTRSGIAEQVQAAGGEMVVMKRFGYRDTEIPQGKGLHEARIYDEVLDADVLINVPIAKDHSLTRLTLGMKNLMGVIYDRSKIHIDPGQYLADLNSRVRPQLTVIDAVRILMDNGPTGGSLEDVKQMDTVIASTDVVATDSFAATLFGMHADELAYIRAATKMGLGRSDLGGLRIEEIEVGA
jgi:uncharacterized protein (DUF362 family)